MAQPILFVILILVIGVTAVSGATDAPNAIATVVSTRCLTPNAAIALAAVFNFVGLVGMTFISTAVAKTMFGMVDFSGDTNAALLALVAAMIGAIAWGIVCWIFGIPCSKSHSLIAGITGGASRSTVGRECSRRMGESHLRHGVLPGRWLHLGMGVHQGDRGALPQCEPHLCEPLVHHHSGSVRYRAFVSPRCARRSEVHVHRHARRCPVFR